jgi:hypothetical protein
MADGNSEIYNMEHTLSNVAETKAVLALFGKISQNVLIKDSARLKEEKDKIKLTNAFVL